MSLCVEHVLIQTDQLRIVGEQQEHVLKGLSQEEALHLVRGIWIDRVADVPYGRVASAGDLRMWAQENVPIMSTYVSRALL